MGPAKPHQPNPCPQIVFRLTDSEESSFSEEKEAKRLLLC
jgi:hypothetical protein